MKIVFVATAFTPEMSGYAGMALPKAIATLPGVKVHVIAPNLNVYHDNPEYPAIYEPFLGPAETLCGTQQINGFTLHRLQHWKYKGQVFIRGLGKKLRALEPDVVHAWIPNGPVSLQLAFFKMFIPYIYFTGQHTTKSVFPLANQPKIGLLDWLKVFTTRMAPGRIISWATYGCYAATSDCGDIAVRFMGVPAQKCLIRNLGVDVELFHPASASDELSQREKMRQELGFDVDAIVCLYTGRLADDKSPLCLAQAIEKLRAEGAPFMGLFIGDGPQKSAIEACAGCVVLPFRDYSELPPFYRMVDVGVWPTQESTSMLDAAASALPIIVSDRLQAKERVDGNGLMYKQNDSEDLTRVLKLLISEDIRRNLGATGREKMIQTFSWKAIAKRTLADFERAKTNACL